MLELQVEADWNSCSHAQGTCRTRDILAITLVQKWVPFGPHFVFCENHGFCCRKWGPIGGHNEKICCFKSKEHLKTSCTKMYVTLSKIENICSNVTKYEPNWPGGSRDMAIYFHGLRQEFWWFWVKIELWRPFRGWSSWVDWPLVRCESVMWLPMFVGKNSYIGTVQKHVEHEMGPNWDPFRKSRFMSKFEVEPQPVATKLAQ